MNDSVPSGNKKRIAGVICCYGQSRLPDEFKKRDFKKVKIKNF
jgi:hypothetical protein